MKCIAGEGLRAEYETVCDGCGRQPLHRPRAWGAQCAGKCSYARPLEAEVQLALCRRCTIGFDLAVYGRSKLLPRELNDQAALYLGWLEFGEKAREVLQQRRADRL